MIGRITELVDRRIVARAITVCLGIWLMAAPAVLGYTGTAADVHRVLGPVAGGSAFVAMAQAVRMLRWVCVPVGALLVIAPVLGFPADAAVNSIGIGLAIAALGFVEGEVATDFGGGWRMIWEGRR